MGGVEESMPTRSRSEPSPAYRNPRPQHPLLVRQTLPFTCGPAALLSVLASCGTGVHRAQGNLQEIELWRESTAVACPGSHPLGLALAAERRGLRARLVWEGPRPWLWSHIRSHHGLLRRSDYLRIETAWMEDGQRRGILARSGPVPCEGSGLLLVEVRGPKGSDRSDPHWVGCWEGPRGAYLLNPLRTVPTPSTRSPEELWQHSGFEGTRCWISLEPRQRTSADPGVDRAPKARGSNPPAGRSRKRFGRPPLSGA